MSNKKETQKEVVKNAFDFDDSIFDLFDKSSNNREIYHREAVLKLMERKNYKSDKDARKHIRKQLDLYVKGLLSPETFIEKFYKPFYKLNDFSVASVYSYDKNSVKQCEQAKQIENFLKKFKK